MNHKIRVILSFLLLIGGLGIYLISGDIQVQAATCSVCFSCAFGCSWTGLTCTCIDEVQDDLDCTCAACYCGGVDPWTCFPAGTKVLMAAQQAAPAGKASPSDAGRQVGGQGYVEKNIEDVKVGDKIISQSEEGKKMVSTVTELDQPVRDHMCKIKFTNGENLKLTDEHPLFTQDGWKSINPENSYKDVPELPVTKLKKGDRIAKSDGTSSEVDYFACWSEKIQTYNLILDSGANTYFADGFLAHNKYVAKTCAEGEALSCGSTAEAVGQNKTHCAGKIECDDLFWPAYRDLPICDDSPIIKYTCYSNCSCCPTGTSRSCTQGDVYTQLNSWESGSIPGGMYTIAAREECATHDDIFISTVFVSDTGGIVTWRATCREQTCSCVSPCSAPNTPTLVSPANNTTSTDTTPTLDWTNVSTPAGCSSRTYQAQVKKTSTTGTNVVNTTGLTSSICTAGSGCPFINGGIVSGDSYYWRVRATTSGGSSDWTGFWKYTVPSPACTVTLAPVSTSKSLGSITAFTATVYPSPSDAPVDQVNFSSLNTSIATVSPASDSTPGPGDTYITNATGEGVSPPSTTIRAGVIMSGAERCFDTSTLTITPPGAWWQVKGGNIHADIGAVWSRIPDSCISPCKPYLILNDISGTTGLVSHYNTVNIGSGEGISEDNNNWQAKSKYKGVKTDYAYFKAILQEDPAGLQTWNGGLPVANGVYLGSGITETASGGSWNVASGRKIVILAPNDLVIRKNQINVASGGFLAIISSGNITLADNTTHVEAVLIADGRIVTCESVSCSSQLTGEGIFVGWGDIDLRRSLAGALNGTAPAESFSYRPDLQANAYNYLLKPGYRWQEVNP